MSSVYFWDLDDGFAGVVLLKKSKSDYLWLGDECKGGKINLDDCSYADRE